MLCVKCKREIPEGSMYCNFCGKKQITEKRKRAKRANHDGGAWKRGSTYTAIWTQEKSELTEDGRIKQFRRTKGGFRTRREAEDYAKMMGEKKNRPAEAPTLKDYWITYRDKKLPKLSKDKQSAYKKAWERLAPLHGKRVDAVFTKDMQKVIDDLGLKYYPAKYMKTVLQRIYDGAAAEGFASKELPDLIELPPLDAKAREPFTEDEQKKIWESYGNGNRDAGMALTMIYTGMMPGELIKLSRENIDFENGLILELGLKTKVRRDTPVVLGEEVSMILKERVNGLPNTENIVFYANEMKFYENYYKALEIAGVRKLTPYSCRHTTATILAVKKNIPREAIKKLMRWSTTKMLDNYAHPTVDDAKAIANEIRYGNTVDNDADNDTAIIRSEQSGEEIKKNP